jgi:hypothetical protein
VKKNFGQSQKSFQSLLSKEHFLKWIFALLRKTYTSNRFDVKKDCFEFLRDLIEQVSISDSNFVGQTIFWNAVLSIARNELDSFDPELRETACQITALIPPLITDLVKVKTFLIKFSNHLYK